MGLSIEDNGKVINMMEWEFINFQTECHMMESGKMGSSMVMAFGRGRKASPILVNGREALLMAMECIHGRLHVVIAMKESGVMG